jgi:hypothetical protein
LGQSLSAISAPVAATKASSVSTISAAPATITGLSAMRSSKRGTRPHHIKPDQHRTAVHPVCEGARNGRDADIGHRRHAGAQQGHNLR